MRVCLCLCVCMCVYVRVCVCVCVSLRPQLNSDGILTLMINCLNNCGRYFSVGSCRRCH